MRRLLLALIASASLPALAEPAPTPAPRPDLFLVDGHDWRMVLPVTVLAAPRTPDEAPVPVLLLEPGKEAWVAHYLDRYHPTAPLLISPERSGGPTFLGVVPTRDSKPAVAGGTSSLLAPYVSDGPVPLVQGRRDRLPLRLAERLLPADEPLGRTVFLVPSEDYANALTGAVLAGAEGGVLLPVGSGAVPLDEAMAFAADRDAPVVWLDETSEAVTHAAETAGVALEALDEGPDRIRRTRAALERLQDRSTDTRHLVITNPADVKGHFSPPHLSVLAPQYALGKRAALVLSGREPADVEAAVARFAEAEGPVTHVTLVGDYLALGMREVLDPDQVHRKVRKPRKFKIPLLAGVYELAPAEYAVARLSAEDAYDLSLQLGRILAPGRTLQNGNDQVLLLSNADLKFIMAELISKATEKEMEQAGLGVASFYGARIDKALIRKELPGKQVIIWEGHPRDLTVDYELGVVDQRLDARLVFLQGCYTLDRNDPYVLVQQGAAAVAGTYMAVYSASGSAFAKIFFDAMLYHGADQGEAMVHARNYLLAYVNLKRKRGHDDWRKTYRAALSFDLWGDPTDRPLVPKSTPKEPAVRLERTGDQLRFRLPDTTWKGLEAGRYTLAMRPGAQLGSIYTRKADWGNERRMQEMYFGWVDLPKQSEPPQLTSPIPDRDWAMVWAPSRRRLYLLVHNDAAEALGADGLRFQLDNPGR